MEPFFRTAHFNIFTIKYNFLTYPVVLSRRVPHLRKPDLAQTWYNGSVRYQMKVAQAAESNAQAFLSYRQLNILQNSPNFTQKN